MSLGAFIFRDIIQYIFPTVIVIGLFLPFFHTESISVEWLVFSGVVIGYLFSSVIGAIVDFLYRHTPFVGRVVREHRTMADWMDKNWDYGALFYSLAHEDREYIYLTSAYMDFYKLVSFYLLLYFILNAAILANGLSVSEYSQIVPVLLRAETPMLGEWVAPTLVLLVLSFVGFLSLFKNYLTEYEILFYPDGQHDLFARNEYRTNPGVAKAVWGRVRGKGESGELEPMSDIRVALLDGQGKEIHWDNTNQDGWFQICEFRDCFSTGTCLLQITPTHPGKPLSVAVKGGAPELIDIE